MKAKSRATRVFSFLVIFLAFFCGGPFSSDLWAVCCQNSDGSFTPADRCLVDGAVSCDCEGWVKDWDGGGTFRCFSDSTYSVDKTGTLHPSGSCCGPQCNWQEYTYSVCVGEYGEIGTRTKTNTCYGGGSVVEACQMPDCPAKTCADYPGECGAALSNDCGGTISCVCPAGKVCSAGACVTPCTTKTPADCPALILAQGVACLQLSAAQNCGTPLVCECANPEQYCSANACVGRYEDRNLRLRQK